MPAAFGEVLDDGAEELSEECMSCVVVEGMEPSASCSLTQLKKPKATRKLCCKTCECRLPLTAATTSSCACGELFCASHMHAHECPFDFRAREQQKLAKSNPKVENSKLDRL